MTAASVTPENSTADIDLFDDVFGSAPASPTRSGETSPAQTQLVDPSDIPRIRSTHVTNGYREGIAASKEKHIQEGFDEGYALGAELGMRVGWCLGVLEGVLNAVSGGPGASNPGTAIAEASADSRPKQQVVTPHRVRAMLEEAKEELQVQRLFDKDYFAADALWTYDVPGQESEGEVTFKEVAEAHPAVKKWMKNALDLVETLGLSLR